MFEKFFGGKKADKNLKEGEDSLKPSIDGVAHVGSSGESPKFYHSRHEGGDNVSDLLENDFDKENSKSVIGKGKRNWYWQDPNDAKVSNERQKEKLGERHSDWKEQNPFEEPEIVTKEEIYDEHLDANADLYDNEEVDDDYEHREAA